MRLEVRETCFFFQAEDGIRDVAVTGVQTCALPISTGSVRPRFQGRRITVRVPRALLGNDDGFLNAATVVGSESEPTDIAPENGHRSEERRVGKECRSRWSPYH